ASQPERKTSNAIGYSSRPQRKHRRAPAAETYPPDRFRPNGQELLVSLAYRPRRRTSLAARDHRRRYDQSRRGAALQERPGPARVQGRSTGMVRKNHRIRRRKPALSFAGARELAVRRLARRIVARRDP